MNEPAASAFGKKSLNMDAARAVSSNSGVINLVSIPRGRGNRGTIVSARKGRLDGELRTAVAHVSAIDGC